MHNNELLNQENKKNSIVESQQDHYLIILLNGEKYFIPLIHVSRIIKEKEIFPLPETYDFIEGVFNFFGEILPAIDIKKVLKITELAFKEERKFIICKVQGLKVCFIIDEVEAELIIDREKIKTDTVKVIENDFISGEYIYEDEVIGIIDILNIVNTYKFKG